MPDCNLTAENLSEWFATPQGGYVLAREQKYFDRTLSDIFGYNALQLGLPEHSFLRNNRMPLRFSAGNQAGNAVRLICTELPFDCDSMDLVVLPHVLEFSDQPHQVLREVAQVLRPEYFAGRRVKKTSARQEEYLRHMLDIVREHREGI